MPARGEEPAQPGYTSGYRARQRDTPAPLEEVGSEKNGMAEKEAGSQERRPGDGPRAAMQGVGLAPHVRFGQVTGKTK